MTKEGFPIRSIRSHVDTEDAQGVVFSRDCPDYEVITPTGAVLHVLVNHFKSQSGGGNEKRRRQAEQVRHLVDDLSADGEYVIVAGDLNEGSRVAGEAPPSLTALFDASGPLVSCYELPGFDPGPRPGSYDSCGLRNRLDYILVSKTLQPAVRGGQVFRRGLWGSRTTSPEDWEVYAEMTEAVHQASDHAALVLRLEL